MNNNMNRIAAATFAAAMLAITPLTTATAEAPAIKIGHRQGCAQEDGPPPCIWDARHMGNGAGDSYILLKGKKGGDPRIKYVPHWVAHRLLHTN